MTIKASAIMSRAATIFFDQTKIRWPEEELLDWLNDAKREIVLQRPDSKSKNTPFKLVSGTKQTLPADGVRFLDVTRNLGATGSTPGRVITLADRSVLDTQRPNWHTEENTARVVKHFTHDPRDPRTFYTFPKGMTAPDMYVELVYSTNPTDCTTGEDPIDLDDIYLNPILDWMLYRGFSKDIDFASNPARAAAHYKAFYTSLGIKAQADFAMAPGNAKRAEVV